MPPKRPPPGRPSEPGPPPPMAPERPPPKRPCMPGPFVPGPPMPSAPMPPTSEPPDVRPVIPAPIPGPPPPRPPMALKRLLRSSLPPAPSMLPDKGPAFPSSASVRCAAAPGLSIPSSGCRRPRLLGSGGGLTSLPLPSSTRGIEPLVSAEEASSLALLLSMLGEEVLTGAEMVDPLVDFGATVFGSIQ